MKINDPRVKQRIEGISNIYPDKKYNSCSNSFEKLSEPFRGTYIDKFKMSFVIENRKDLDNLIRELSQIHFCLRS
jgi:hypothetical protein